MEYFNIMLIITMLFFPIMVLAYNTYLAVKNKKLNHPIAVNIVISILSSLFIVLPFVFLLIDKDGLAFPMMIVVEIFALCVLMPWSIFAYVLFWTIKKLKLKPSKEKIFVLVGLISILFLLVCFGTFSGFYFEAFNKLIGGPT